MPLLAAMQFPAGTHSQRDTAHQPIAAQDDEQQTHAGVLADDDAFQSTSDESTSFELQQELDRAALMAKAYKASSTHPAPQRPNGTSDGDDLIDVEASAKGKKTIREQLQSKMATLAMSTMVRGESAIALGANHRHRPRASRRWLRRVRPASTPSTRAAPP